MEVAESAGDAVQVTQTLHPESNVMAMLRPWERLRMLSTCVLDDGTKRACIAREHGSLLGWITVAPLHEKPNIYRHARPIYEVSNVQLKVRRGLELHSKFVAKLRPGTRIHLAELVQMADGSTRARVAVLSEAKLAKDRPIGWVTVIREKLGAALVQRVVIPGEEVPIRSTVSDLLQACVASYSASANTLESQRVPFFNPIVPLSRSPDGSSANGSPGVVAAGFFGSSIAGETVQAEAAWHLVLGRLGEMVHSSVAERKRHAPKHASVSSIQPVVSPLPTNASATPPPSEPPPLVYTIKTPAVPDSSSMPAEGVGSGSSRKASKGRHGRRKEEIDQRTKAVPGALATAAEISAIVDNIHKEADIKERALEAKDLHSLPVMLGAILQARISQEGGEDKVFDMVVREWDPNRDGSISRMELRQGVRKLMDHADTKEVDDLCAPGSSNAAREHLGSKSATGSHAEFRMTHLFSCPAGSRTAAPQPCASWPLPSSLSSPAT